MVARAVRQTLWDRTPRGSLLLTSIEIELSARGHPLQQGFVAARWALKAGAFPTRMRSERNSADLYYISCASCGHADRSRKRRSTPMKSVRKTTPTTTRLPPIKANLGRPLRSNKSINPKVVGIDSTMLVANIICAAFQRAAFLAITSNI